MKLTRCRIANYKVIDDSGPIDTDPRVTALVGKNESGKTAILRALWKSHNVASATFDRLYDYPRDRYLRERRSTQLVTALEFSLDEEDRLVLARHLAPDQLSVSIETVVLVSRYDGPDQVSQAVYRDFEATDELGPAALEWLQGEMPTFIYFDEYGQLETRIHLPTYLSQRGNAHDAKTRTQTALFEWSGIDPQEILDLGRPRGGESDEQVARRHEERRALLDSASFSLTGDWTQWWPEKRHKLHFGADGEDLVLKVSDEHNEFPIPFEERSRGFQWFFSFYLVFLVESEQAHKDAILLLDEPGLHLHPSLQIKLIDLFERISGDNQLIYSTHMPFLIDGNHLERVRTVFREGPEPQNTVVSGQLKPSGDRDTLFPIQAALGYSIAQTLFLGKRSLIVEGITDYWIIRALSSCMASLDGMSVLHEDTVLIPAEGTSNLMPLASIMFASTGMGDRRLLVLLDSDQAGRVAQKRLIDQLGGELPAVMLGDIWGLDRATIEDIVPRDLYVDVVRGLGFDLDLSEKERNARTTAEALESAFQRCALGSFRKRAKAQATLALIDRWANDPDSIPEYTTERAGRLMDRINHYFDQADGKE